MSRYPNDRAPVRSQWEINAVYAIKSEYPHLKIITNDRTIIRKGLSKLEIDIYIPSLKLGFELNGKAYHSYDNYVKAKCGWPDTYSKELYKERYCAKKGIELCNVWEELYNRPDSYDFIIEKIREKSNSAGTKDTTSYDDYKPPKKSLNVDKIGIWIVVVIPLVVVCILCFWNYCQHGRIEYLLGTLFFLVITFLVAKDNV